MADDDMPGDEHVVHFPTNVLNKIATGKTYTERMLAIEYIARYRHLLRHDAMRSKEWTVWNGHTWVADCGMSNRYMWTMLDDIVQTMHRDDVAVALAKLPHNLIKTQRDQVRDRTKAINAQKEALMMSGRFMRSVLSIAKGDPDMIIQSEEWDRDPWLLNTQEGTINLRTGTVHPHDPKNYITKCCRVSVDYTQPTPIWDQFMWDTFQSQDMIDYMQRVLGYCLTGNTTEHAIFYLWGSGQNGKTTLTETVSRIMGDYSIDSPPQVFVTGESRHPAEIARMAGARLITSDELPHGQTWDTSKLKRLTGGSKISARHLYGHDFEFTPQLKLLIAGNDRPKIEQLDDGIRRRLNLVPFAYKVPDNKKDKYLLDKLHAEAPGILGWLVHGCLQWQREGLNPPEVIRNATTKYLNSQDAIANWMDECCVRHQDAHGQLDELYSSWAGWCKLEERPAGSRNKLSSQLAENAILYNIEKCRNARGIFFRGIDLIDRPPPLKPTLGK